jgi:hypothetical protein
VKARQVIPRLAFSFVALACLGGMAAVLVFADAVEPGHHHALPLSKTWPARLIGLGFMVLALALAALPWLDKDDV